MSKQSVKVELFYNGVWNDVTSSPGVFVDTITVRQGMGDESGGFRPCQITGQLDNTDDRFRTSNPLSPLYGIAGRNTPIRVSVGGTIRGIAESSSWSCDQTQDFRQTPRRGMAWADVTAGGVLQRVSQWTQPLRSALYRYVALSGVTPGEWWPMEDVSGSSGAVSAAAGNPMTPVTAVRYTLPDGTPIPPGGAPDFARGAGVGGSAPLANFQGGGTLSAPIRTDTYNGYAVDWVMQFQAGTDAGGTSSADVLSWRENGTYVHFTVNVTKGHVDVLHANPTDDAALASTGKASAAFDVYDGTPHHFRYQVRQNGGSYLAQLLIDSAVYATAVNFAGGMVGTVGRPTYIEWNPGEVQGNYMPIAAGHLIVWKSGQIGGQPAVFNALNGYAGERAANRFGRLCGEEGIPYSVSTGSAKSMTMGPQRPDTLSNLFKEIAITDDALLFDYGLDLRLFLLCRADRMNQAPALTLTPADFPALPREVTDDLAVANVVTASQRDGGDATATDSTGPLGTQAPPAGIGQVKQTAEVSLYDPGDDLEQVANWYLRRGTVNLPRYPELTLDLDARPGIVSAVNAITVGSVIQITGLREYTIRLHVLGWTETIGAFSRSITFTCAPDRQFHTQPLDTGRLGAAATTLNGSLTTTDTALTLKMTDVNEQWRTGNNAVPILVAGEQITLGTVAAVSGSGPWTQAVTGCTRSVNGIVKTHAAGDPVTVVGAIRLGLQETT